jgi:predicted metallopeptidase
MKSETLRREKINLTDVLTLIIREIVSRVETFHHIDTDRMLICAASNKSTHRGATFGKLVPLRFKDGAAAVRYRGKGFCMPRVLNNGVEQLYIIYFYYPKFFNLPPHEKLRVIFHELYHVSPEFNGDIRRMSRGKASHGGSRKNFDRLFEEERRDFFEYVAATPFMNFLDMDALLLEQTFGRVRARRMKVPKPMPLPAAQKL